MQVPNQNVGVAIDKARRAEPSVHVRAPPKRTAMIPAATHRNRAVATRGDRDSSSVTHHCSFGDPRCTKGVQTQADTPGPG